MKVIINKNEIETYKIIILIDDNEFKIRKEDKKIIISKSSNIDDRIVVYPSSVNSIKIK